MSTSDLVLLHQWHTRRNARAFHELVVRHTPMVYATCRRVLRDESGAEDVTQECFEMLATAKRPPKSQLPAWLHRVATNRSLDKLRSAGSRVKREREYVELQKGHDEINWDDMYTHIDEIIDDLPDKTRHAIVAAFLENRSQTAVASDLGVTPQAVSKRISRGIETIRTQLRKRGVEVSAATLTTVMTEKMVEATVPATLASMVGKIALAGKPSLAKTGGSLAGSVTVGKLVAAMVVTAVVVAGAVAYMKAHSPADPQMTTVAETARPAPGVSDDLPEIEDQGREQVDSRNDGADDAVERRSGYANMLDALSKTQQTRLASLSGRVLLPDSRPLAGAQVTARVDDNLGYDPYSTSAKTGDDGEFELHGFEVTGGIYMVATSAGFSSGDVGPLTLTADGIRNLELILRPTGSLSGHVIDLHGKPVPDGKFRVELIHRTMGRNAVGLLFDALDESGAFKIDNLKAGSYGLYINARPLHQYTGEVRPLLTVDLAAGEHLTGIELAFDYDRHLKDEAARAAAPRPARRQEPRTVDVEGQVVRSDTHEPVEHFRVRAQYTGRGTRPSDDTIARADGRFSLEPRHGEKVELLVESEGLAPGRVTFSVDDNGVVSGDRLLVRLDPGAVVKGAVVDQQGAPVVGASIYVDFDFNILLAADYISGERAAVTDSEGAFHLDALASAPTTLYIQHPSHAPESARATPVQSRPTFVQIVMREGGAIEGTVRRAGVAQRDRDMMLLNADGVNVQTGGSRTDADGRFRIEYLTPGIYTAYTGLYNDSSVMQFRQAEVAQGLTTRVDFADPAVPATLEGSVLLDGETPANLGFKLEVQTEYGSERFSNRGWVTTGTIRVEDIPTGVATLSITAIDANHERVTLTEEFEITEGATLRRDFSLQTRL